MNTSKDSNAAFLLVMSGLHHGAHVPLQQDALLVVGSGDDSDICLSDPGLSQRHFALAVHGEQITVRRLDGEIAVDGQSVDSVVTLDVAAGESLELVPGGVQLRIATDANRHDFTTTAERACMLSERRAAPRAAKRRALAVAAALIGGVLLGTLVIAGQREEQVSTESITPRMAIQALIDGLELQDELAVDESFGRLIVRGTLPLQDLSRLQEGLLESPAAAVLRVTTAEQLLEQVSGVFRTNGYTAELSYRGNATVVVENLDGDSAEIRKVAAFVRADVANLKKLVFTPSDAPESSDTSSAVYLASAGKRLTTVVDGETAYIATEDGARYFVGSTLPGGHYVRKITAQGVQVNSGDTISWLQF